MIVLDEFPYLVAAAPELPSVLQREIDRGVTARQDLKLDSSASRQRTSRNNGVAGSSTVRSTQSSKSVTESGPSP
jgi:hypothetical protein